MAQLNVIMLFLLADTHCIVFTKFIFRSEILCNQNLGVRHMCPGSQSFKKKKQKTKTSVLPHVQARLCCISKPTAMLTAKPREVSSTVRLDIEAVVLTSGSKLK